MICEKPLGRDADETYEIWQRVAAAGVKHMCAFNYRFVPAVRLAREMIAAGELGEIRHYRYLAGELTTVSAITRSSSPTAPVTGSTSTTRFKRPSSSKAVPTARSSRNIRS